ncbi:DUF3558 domain-containing protein [Amycolatopsis sp., V23-08]|uniref:DUF3558 domain-containing protein n=1 Tax=Amycolatopsis heterodermiae TaxID=3110235 RepID=A0ABU5QYI4_9PSEU|nr:DUF3558 domain-containing protein [Amycolatopsis sp., V23-08]MEA5358176.1 DUF3558 domain-containing protein [Amycolatopsis sp., V23-08]
MLPDVRRRRLPKLFLLVTALTLTLTACGQDLGRSNFARTTVPAAAGTGPSSDGPITDAAVAANVLRTVKPCQFLTKDALGPLGLGTVEEDPTPSSISYDRCTNKVKDPGGKEMRLDFEIGSTLLPRADKTTGQVGGLPLRVDKTDDSDCTVAAMTALNPDTAVTVTVAYAGDPCRPGQTVLDAVVQKLHNSPEKYPTPPGTLLTADACTMAESSVVASAAPSPKQAPTGLHSCDWTSNGANPTVSVEFLPGLPPLVGDGYSKVDLGGGITGFQKKGTASAAECNVEWQHRPWQGDDVELAQVRYRNYNTQPDTDDACGKAVTVAKNVVTKLPKP